MTHPYLYHGSATQNLKILEPRKRYTPSDEMGASIYATPSAAFAATHSFPWSTDEGVGLDVHGNHVVLTLPERMRPRLQVRVSIYKMSADIENLKNDIELNKLDKKIFSVKKKIAKKSQKYF
jgi:hypothetical protein